MGQLIYIKSEAYRRNRKLKDVWAEANKKYPSIDFPAFSRIINGYQRIPDGFEFIIAQIFDSWDNGMKGLQK